MVDPCGAALTRHQRPFALAQIGLWIGEVQPVSTISREGVIGRFLWGRGPTWAIYGVLAIMRISLDGSRDFHSLLAVQLLGKYLFC